MGIIRKYAFPLVLVFAVIYVYAPLSLEEVAKLPWLDDINIIVNKTLAPATPEAGVSPVDPIAAANVDEDLDYRIAQRTKSTEGWRSFLAAHPAGLHAQSARSELDKRVSVEKPPAPVAAQASLSDIKTPSEDTSSDQPSPRSEVASDEICRRDEDGLERLSHSPTSDEAMRFLTELRCEKLRPEVFRLTERLDYQAPPAADLAIQSPSSWVAARLEDGERLNLKIRRTGVSLRAAFSQDDMRTGGRPLAYRRSFWRFSASSPGTRPRSDEPKPAPDWVAALAAEERAKPWCQRISCELLMAITVLAVRLR